MGNQEEYGVEWAEFNKKDQMVTKRKVFKTAKARDKFAKKLEEKDNFCCFGAWLN